MVAHAKPLTTVTDLNFAMLQQVIRHKNIIDVIRLAQVALEKESGCSFFSLALTLLMVINTLEPNVSQFLDHIRVVPPAIWLVPYLIAIEITQHNGVAITKLVSVDLQVFPKLPNVAEGVGIYSLGPYSQ